MIRGTARKAWLALIVIGASGLIAGGCGKTKPTDASGGPEPMTGPGSGGPGGTGVPVGPTSADVLAKLPGGEEYAAGKRVYANNNCARCHKLGETGAGGPPGPMGGGPGGPGGPGGGKGPRGGMNGPNLTAVGADSVHTKDWIAAHVRDPKAHKPQSRMPASGPEKIGDADLDALAAYLASRK